MKAYKGKLQNCSSSESHKVRFPSVLAVLVGDWYHAWCGTGPPSGGASGLALVSRDGCHPSCTGPTTLYGELRVLLDQKLMNFAFIVCW